MEKIYNEVELFAIGPEILNIPHPKIQDYKEGKISQVQFLKSLTEEDPFIILNGRLTLIRS